MSTTKADFQIVENVASNPENTLVLVGTALDGPSHTPFMVNRAKPVDELIGDSPLARAYVSAARTDLSNIILYRINGTHATGRLLFGIEVVMKFVSVSANDSYNDILIDVGPDKMTAISVDGTARHYFFSVYPSAGLLAEAINLDASYGLIEFIAQAVDPSFDMTRFDIDNSYTVLFSGGTTESSSIPNRAGDVTTTIASLEEKLKAALFGSNVDDQDIYEPNSTLGLMDYGAICLVDMFHDDPANFTNLLANFCQNKSILNGSHTIGIIGTTPLLDPTDLTVSDKVLNLISKSLSQTTNAVVSTDVREASPLSYVQVVVGDTTLGALAEEAQVPISLAYAYAGTQAYLPYNTPLTNKSLQGVGSLNYEFAKKDIEQLLSNGYISIVSSIRKGYVPYYAVTAIGNNSGLMKHPHVVRTAHAVIRRVVDYLDGYIGDTSTPTKRRAMEKNVDEVISEFVKTNIIRNFSTQFHYSTTNGEASVSISLVPFSSVGTISSVVSMPFG